MKLFLFGIGGTGARVLRSLTMLLAAGAKAPADLTIIPILLDMDMQNGDTERALRLVEQYRTIRRIAYKDTAASQGTQTERRTFFATPLQPLGTLQAENAQERIGDSVLPKLTEHQGTFEEFLQVSSMEEIDREFLKLFYDNSAKPTSTELKLNLSVGFKGNPNIGSVVFNSLEDSAVYKYFTGAFNNETDRVFIISSIFGGTGSSGFPQLVKLLQHPSQKMHIRNARKGAVTVMPYFALEENTQSSIDQNRFLSKTKAALSYYQNQIDLDALYYIGDKPGSKLYPNVEGGSQQLNNAHVVELLAAESILHFASKHNDDFTENKRFYEYGLKRNDRRLDLPHFHDSTYHGVLEPLIRFTYATKLFTDFVPANLGEAFAKNLALPQNLNTSTFYQALRNFLGHHYKEWLREMAENDRSFHPFDLGAEFNSVVRAKRIETSFFDKGISDRFLREQAGRIEHNLQGSFPQTEQRFMQLLIDMAEKCRDKLGALNRELTDV
ncbi:tubulin-like doman-containing protein [Tellurirhabdus bombi]|uniref:tubulin-like doman-containing protein n=1 Tax=Tellurirhabdus bombi TaxID=2907205 RepID=UPI001F444CE7|nr:tubulin-like doman-containing protein [Tellurirhabdus bombi]